MLTLFITAISTFSFGVWFGRWTADYPTTPKELYLLLSVIGGAISVVCYLAGV